MFDGRATQGLATLICDCVKTTETSLLARRQSRTWPQADSRDTMAAILQGGRLISGLFPPFFSLYLKSNYINKAALVQESDQAALEPVGSRECNVGCLISSCTQVAF